MVGTPQAFGAFNLRLDYDPSKDITYAFVCLEFQSIIRYLADLGSNEPILWGMVSEVWFFEFGNSRVSSVAGIEYFIALEDFVAINNELVRVDMSANTELVYLDLRWNFISSVNQVIGWQAHGLVLGDTFLFDPQHGDITGRFEDNNFLVAVREAAGVPTGSIYLADVENVTFLNVSRRNIHSLAGIEHFSGLVELNASNNWLTELNLSNNSMLERVDVSFNELVSINVANNVALRHLDVYDNLLESLDVTSSVGLVSVDGRVNDMVFVHPVEDIAAISTVFLPPVLLQGNQGGNQGNNNVQLPRVVLTIDGPSIVDSPSVLVSGLVSVNGGNAPLRNMQFFETAPSVTPTGAIDSGIEGVFVGTGITGVRLDADVLAGAGGRDSYRARLALTGTTGDRLVWVQIPLPSTQNYDGNRPPQRYAFAKLEIRYDPVIILPTIRRLTATPHNNFGINTTRNIVMNGVTAPLQTLEYWMVHFETTFLLEIENDHLVDTLFINIEGQGTSPNRFAPIPRNTPHFNGRQFQVTRWRHDAPMDNWRIGMMGAGVIEVFFTRAGDPTGTLHLLGSFPVRVLIDPSGFVYEAVPSNRLEGVTVTVYYMGRDGEAVLWNAEEWNQENPLVTNHVGFYEWMVPRGMWQVRAEKDGFETHLTDWLPVPPPQLDVNFGMISRAAPYVYRILPFERGIEIEFSRFMQVADVNTSNITVTVGGNPVSGRIEMLNRETDFWYSEETGASGGTGLDFVSKVMFIPDAPFTVASGIRLNVNQNVRSYANVPMSSNFALDLTVILEAQSIIARDVTFGQDQSGNMVVEIFPADAGAGRRLYLQSSNTEIATVPVTSSLPGLAFINISLEDSSLTAMAEVDVLFGTIFDPDEGTLSGEVSSFNPRIPIELELLQNGVAVNWTSIAPDANGSGQTTRNFMFSDVSPGVYSLRITKAGHAPFVINNIVASDEDIDLRLSPFAEVRVITLLPGDLTGNGFIVSVK
jgi:hypothetical protein